MSVLWCRAVRFQTGMKIVKVQEVSKGLKNQITKREKVVNKQLAWEKILRICLLHATREIKCKPRGIWPQIGINKNPLRKSSKREHPSKELSLNLAKTTNISQVKMIKLHSKAIASKSMETVWWKTGITYRLSIIKRGKRTIPILTKIKLTTTSSISHRSSWKISSQLGTERKRVQLKDLIY